MKKLLTAGVIALGCVAGTAEAATTITFTPGGTGLPMAANTVSIQNFDSLAAGSSIGTNAYVYSASSSGQAVKPSGATNNFAAVGINGSYNVSFTPTNMFSFVLGSLDSYNTLTLRYSDGTSTLLSGTQITNGSALGVDGLVSYTVTSGPFISGATFGSTGQAFEFDTLAEAVPEPAAWGMMILGFGMVGGVLRRRTSAKVQLA